MCASAGEILEKYENENFYLTKFSMKIHLCALTKMRI